MTADRPADAPSAGASRAPGDARAAPDDAAAGGARTAPDRTAPPGASDPDDAAAPHHGRYVIRDIIARGGMGEVHLAWDPALRRELALKTLHDDGGGPHDTRARQRFLEEAQIGGRLDHPGIVPVHDLGHDADEQPFFTMRLVAGQTLHEILEGLRAGSGEWTTVRVLGVLLKVCETMAFAHDRGIVHRDLKPANVMVGPYGEVYVMDWGLAHRLDEDDPHDLRPVLPEVTSLGGAPADDSPLLTREGDVIGTPAFMSPEQALGDVDQLGPRTDVYAVGAILYQLATGSMPHVGRGERVSAGAVWERVRGGPPRPVAELAPGLPPELVAICEKAMARDPAARYADMAALARDVRAFLEGHVVRAHRTGAVVEFRKWVQRNRPVAVTLAASLAVVVLGSVISAAILAGKNDELEQARDLADERRGLAVAALDRESAARRDAEQAAQREELARVAAEDAAEREALVRREAVAAAQREADARRAAELATANEAAARREAEAAASREIEAREAAELAAAREAEARREADLARGEAELAEHAARRQAYRANVAAAAAHLELGNRRSARERLEACDPLLSGWERDVLETRLNPALRTWDFGASAHVNALALSPDGARVAAGGSTGSLVIHDLASGERLAAPPLSGYVRDLVFTRDGRRLLVAEGADDVTQRDAATGALLTHLRGHRGAVNALALSPDGARLASASDDGTARLWDASTGEALARVEHGGPVAAVAFAPRSALLATAGDDGRIRLWDGLSARSDGQLVGHAGRVEALAFDHTGEWLLSGGADDRLVLWDLFEGRPRLQLDVGAAVHAVDIAPDGARLLAGCGDGSLRLFDAADGAALAVVEGHLGAVHDAAFTADGRELLSASADGTLRQWDPTTRAGPARLAGHDDIASCVTLSRDGRLLASGSFDRSVRVLDATSGDLRHVLEGHESTVHAVAFADGGRRLVSSDQRGGVLLWDLERGERLTTLRGGGERIAFVTASPDGRLVACAAGGRGNRTYVDGRVQPALDDERVIQVWDARSGALRLELPGQRHGTTVVAFSGDGARLVSGSQAGGLAVWDARDGRLLRELAAEPRPGGAPELPPVSFLAVDHTGDVVVSAHLSRLMSLVVWDAAVGERRHVLRGHDTRVWSVVLTPDGRRALSTGEDGSVRVWDTADGEQLLSLREPGLAGLWVAMRADGRRLVSSTLDGGLVVWDTDVGDARALWSGRARRARAGALVDELLDEHVLPGRALAALDAAEFASPGPDGGARDDGSARSRGDGRDGRDGQGDDAGLRDAARRLLQAMPEPSVAELNRAAWRVVREPGHDARAFAAALLRAETADARAPGRAALLNTLGLALHRNGRHDDALAVLLRADALNTADPDGYPRASDLAAMALCLASLQRDDEARVVLDAARASLQGVDDAALRALLAEAEALLAAE